VVVVNEGCRRWLERGGNKKEKGTMTYFVLFQRLCCVVCNVGFLRLVYIILYLVIGE